jgi:hypothetical protein
MSIWGGNFLSKNHPELKGNKNIGIGNLERLRSGAILMVVFGKTLT